MKFLCERCKTRYSIGDDCVRGKISKIRCKNCANVITVREGMVCRCGARAAHEEGDDARAASGGCVAVAVGVEQRAEPGVRVGDDEAAARARRGVVSCDATTLRCEPTCTPGNGCGAGGQLCCAGRRCNAGLA